MTFIFVYVEIDRSINQPITARRLSSVEELLQGLRKPLSDHRRKVVEDAFARFATDGTGKVRGGGDALLTTPDKTCLPKVF